VTTADRLAAAWREAGAAWRGRRRADSIRWAMTVVAGLALSLLASVGAARATRSAGGGGVFDWERTLLEELVGRSSPSLFDAITLDAFGATVILVPLILTLGLREAAGGRPLLALSILLAYLGGKAITLAGWASWHRARPELVLEGRLNPGEASAFPSGHMVQAVAVFGLLCWVWGRRGGRLDAVLAAITFVLVVAGTAVSRLRLAAHWPTDVAAGALLGVLWVGTLLTALRVAREPIATSPDVRGYTAPGAD
jgi:membrane-associated phospholipid phosphatase